MCNTQQHSMGNKNNKTGRNTKKCPKQALQEITCDLHHISAMEYNEEKKTATAPAGVGGIKAHERSSTLEKTGPPTSSHFGRGEKTVPQPPHECKKPPG